MGNLVEDGFGADEGEMIVDPLASGSVPFQEGHQSAATPQVRREFRPGDAHGVLGDQVGVVSDHDPPTIPGDPVEIGNGSLYIQAAAVRPDCLADCSAPVIDAGNPEWEESGLGWQAVVGQAPEGERFELALSDHNWNRWVAQEHLANAGHQVQHIRPAWRAEVLLSGFEIAGGVVFEIRLIPAQAVLAEAIGTRMEIRNKNTGIVAALATNDLATSKRIGSSEAGSIR